MGRLFLIGGVSALIVLAVSALLVVLAAVNLNRIIEANRSYVVGAASDALGRRVSVRRIRAELGWGVLLKLEDVAVAEDPAFASRGPFFHAASVSGRVSVLPLLTGRVEVGRLAFETAQIRITRNAQGLFNFATLGKIGAKAAPAAGFMPSRGASLRPVALWSQAGPAGPGRVKSVTVEGLGLADSEVIYSDALYAAQVTLRKVDLTLEPLDPERPCNLAIRLALLGDEQNFRIDGRVGPLASNGKLDLAAARLELAVAVGPLVPDRLRSLSSPANRILAAVSIPDPVSLKGRVAGSPGAPVLSLGGDLTQARASYGELFAKPSGVALKLDLRGEKRADGFSLSAAELTLASLHATGRDFTFAPGRITGDFQIDRFDLSPWSALLPAFKDYRLSGSAQAHAKAELEAAKVLLNGALKLVQVAAAPQAGGPARLSGLDAVVNFTGDGATLEPAEFNLGSARIALRGQADSLSPLHAVYALSSPQVSAADLIAGYAREQYQARAVAASGEVAVAALRGAAATTALASTDGRLDGVPYRDLKLKALYREGQLRLQSMTLNAYDGAVDAGGAMSLDDRVFEANLKAAGIDLGQIAERVGNNGGGRARGRLSGQATVSGRGDKLAQIEPTLRGAGRFEAVNGAVPGINPAAAMLKALSDMPGLGRVLSPDIAARYPRVFRSPDMQFESASATFKIDGPQISSQDIRVVAADYTITGGGWVNLDQRIDIKADIILSGPFSRDLMQRNQVLALMADGLSQVHVPLVLSGTLSKVSVRPDASVALQRVQPGAVENLGKKLLRNLFK